MADIFKVGGSAGVTESVSIDDAGVITASGGLVGPVTGNASSATAEKAAAHFTHAVPLYVDMAGATYQLTTANCTSETLVVDANGTGGGTSAQILKLLSNATSTGKRLRVINAGGEAITIQTSAGADLAFPCVLQQSTMALFAYTTEAGWIPVQRTPAVFISSEITGNASSQSTAHGLGITPTVVIPTVVGYTSGAFAVTVGTHTATNCIFTVTNGVKYRIFAAAL